jgi:hypothetical protein
MHVSLGDVCMHRVLFGVREKANMAAVNASTAGQLIPLVNTAFCPGLGVGRVRWVVDGSWVGVVRRVVRWVLDGVWKASPKLHTKTYAS